MNRVTSLLVGAVAVLAFATVFLVLLPAWQLRQAAAPEGLQNYTVEQLRGRAQYISNGCVYCHSQQPRATGQTLSDLARGWGRASTPGDYAHDAPHLLGTMRTGPDLLNVGARLPSRDWHLTHLYQPRAIFDWSIMPSYPYLFEKKARPDAGDVVVKLPPALRPADGGVIVARQEALDLAAYLLSLNRSYAVSDKEAAMRDQGYDPRALNKEQP